MSRGDWECRFGPSRLVFGSGAVERLGRLTRDAGGSRALVVTDRGLCEVGHVARAREALRRAGVAAAVYDGVGENPTTRHVDEATAVAREHGADCLIGFGGGSAMDCAKAVNFLLTNGGRMEDYRGSGKAARPMLPSLGVPTTAGTGSEAQSFALISRHEDKAKMACGDPKAMFRAVVLDPALAATVPRRVAAIAGIDAVAHAVESYVTRPSNPISRLHAREAWRRLEASLPVVLETPDDLEAWGRMLVGAFLAGAAIEESMLGAAHACANPLTTRFDVPHGIAVALLLPHVVRFNAAHVGPRYEELRAAANGAPAAGLLEERIVELRSIGGLPGSLRDLAVPRGSLAELAAEAEAQWTASFNPRPVDRASLLALYEAAY